MPDDFTAPRPPARRVWRKDRANAVGNLLGARLGQLGIEEKVREHMAPLVWAEMVGPQVAAATEAERVRDGVLFVATRSATWAHELTFHKKDILRRLNDRIGARPGRPLITDLRFFNKGQSTKKPAAEAPPSLRPTRGELEDIELSPEDRAAVERDIAAIADETLRERVRRARITDARLRLWRMDNGWCPCPECGDLAPPRFPYDGTVDCPRCRIRRMSQRR